MLVEGGCKRSLFQRILVWRLLLAWVDMFGRDREDFCFVKLCTLVGVSVWWVCVCVCDDSFITKKSSLVPLIVGLCAQIYFRFEISVVLLTSSSFLFL